MLVFYKFFRHIYIDIKTISYYFFNCFLLNTGECKNILKDILFIIYRIS